MSDYGKLYLLPVPISEEEGSIAFIPEYNLAIVRDLTYFIAEDAKTARRCLKSFGYAPMEQAQIALLNEHTKQEQMADLLGPVLRGNDAGLMSDAGCPGIADPGTDVVRRAHQKGIEVIPLVGPSSIVLSIMASGFNGQNFAFVGYLPIEKPLRIKRLKELEQQAQRQQQAQFFIETPYRNDGLFEALISTLQPTTSLFVGRHITAPGQLLQSKTVAAWKKEPAPDLKKVPAVFGIYK